VIAWRKSGQRTTFSIPNNAVCNGHPSDAGGADLSRRYYERELRSLSVGDVVAVGEAGLAVGRVGWTPVRGGLAEVRTAEHGTRPLPARTSLPDTADRLAIPCPDQGAT